MASLISPGKPIPNDDLGLGLRTGPARGVNKDGSFNVRRAGRPLFRGYELYHSLITMGGFQFLALLFLGFLVTNALFAAVYLGLGMEHFIRTGGSTRLDQMLDAFFFSAQTLTTVGYGHISPNSHLVSAVAALESLLGLLSFALATGLLYGRFSRPHAQMCFSHHALVAPYRGITGFMFRFANRRSNQLIEVEATVSMSFLDGDNQTRRYVALELERSKINLFPTSWTVVHPIDESSPLHGMTEADLRRSQAEFIVLIKAFDDTFAQTIYQRTSYVADEVLWGFRFKPMASLGPDGSTEFRLRDVGAVEAAEGAQSRM
ncbi:inward rectifier potassium channel Irk [Geothrix limicola]|uniref:Inward rectifier potassium channel Irk n=1 Tax=Geothrix limicola TaxID=2927978 RepID=A0ABQ5QFR9_9BACT|nr:ion channel [Geothrix limicola]GLH73497.1 inward rectifier potassium channel Irk [Geothrix limicola]